MEYVIKDRNGSYFRDMVAIGPRFGDLDTAARFPSEQAAGAQMAHWAFATCRIVPVAPVKRPTKRAR